VQNASVRVLGGAWLVGVLAWALVALPPAVLGATSLGGDLEDLDVLVDAKGVVHLVGGALRPDGQQRDIIHRTRVPGGAWSPATTLTGGMELVGTPELSRDPGGGVCVTFDAWPTGRDTRTAGLYQACWRDGVRTAPAFVEFNSSITAAFGASLTAAGETRAIAVIPPSTIMFRDQVLWDSTTVAGGELEVDAGGRLHAAWGAFTKPAGILWAVSEDDGRTWSEPVDVLGGGDWHQTLDLRADELGRVHLLVPGTIATYRRWTAETGWEAPVRLATELGLKRLAITPAGTAVVAWRGGDAVSVLTQQADGSWTAPSPIDPTPVDNALGGSLAVAVDAQGGIEVLWSDGGLFGAGAETAQPGFARSVPSPLDVSLDPVIVATGIAIAAGTVVLVPFPAQLFNSTVEANYGEISARVRGSLGRLSRRAERSGSFWRTPAGIALFFVVAAILSAFLDPSLALDATGLATIAGLLVGLVAVATGFALPEWLVHRRAGGRGRIDVLPLALPVAAACVLVSRVTSFEPGYLYGLLAGVTLVGDRQPGDEGRAAAIASVWVLLLSIAAWIALVPVRAASSGEVSLPLVAVEAGLSTVVVAGLEAVVFGLLPLRFLPGASLFRTDRRLWAAVFGLALFAFLHILVNPASGYLTDTSRVPLVTTIALFVGFAAVSVLVWAYFRFRKRAAIGPA
jgi:hypothetical protein